MFLVRIFILFIASLSLPGCFASAVLGTAAATTTGVHDERTVGRQLDDAAISSKIDARLIAERDMPSRWIGVEVIRGRVILTGHLPTRSHIERAVYITKQIRGVTSVNNKLEIGQPKIRTVLSDSWITTRIKRALWNDKLVSGFKIHVDTVNGKVYLQGVVKSLIERQRAKDIARGTPGVTAVVDLMQSDNS
ncbi:MAG: BON domain-containing protein [Mariprofundus sp.]|nr:BON domain-containing protein [Mariprofundus sp.]